MRHEFLSVLLILSLIFLSGCTVHFKGKDIEIDAEPPLTFQLESIGIFESPDSGIVIEPVRFAKK